MNDHIINRNDQLSLTCSYINNDHYVLLINSDQEVIITSIK